MTTLHITVAGKTATYLRRDGAIVCGNDDYRVAFTFDDEWAAYENKTARFIWGGRYYDQPIEDNEAPVPDLDNATELFVGLYVEGDEKHRTTTSASIPCLPSVTSGGELPRPENGEGFADAAKQAAFEAKASAEAAAESAAEAAESAAEAAQNSAAATEAATQAQTHAATAEAAKTAAEEAAESASKDAAAIAGKHGELDRLHKRVTNLEQGITPDPFHVDDAVAYVKDVPARALPFAQIDAVGGMTYKTIPELPIDPSYLGELWAQDTDPSRLTEATVVQMFPGAVVGKTYSLAYDVSPSNGSLGFNDPSTGKTGDTITLTETTVLSCSCGGTDAPEYTSFSNVRLIGEGVLRETKVTAIESVGKNLFDCANAVKYSGLADIKAQSDSGITVVAKNTGYYTSVNFFLPEWLVGKQVTLSGKWTVSGNNTGALCVGWANGSTVGENVYARFFNSGGSGTAIIPEKPSKDHHLVLLLYAQGDRGTVTVGDTVTYTDIQLEIGDTATEYIPYRKHTLDIPAEVQALDGYGWSAENMYYGAKRFATNSIEWDDGGKASFVKRVGRKVFDGTGAWNRVVMPDASVYFEIVPANKKPNGAAFTNKYPADLPASIPHTRNPNYGFLVFPDNPPTTADAWKAQVAAWYAAGNPLVLYYELETPVVTDISHLITRDNFIEVEGGGVIIAQNENADAAPTAVVYQLKPEA